MPTPSESWDESSPAGSDSISLGDNRIRQLKTQIREVIDVDHDFPSSGQADDVGQHKKCTFQEQADLGTGAVNATILGSQTINGKGELVYTDEDDNDIQVTKAGVLKPSTSTVLADWSAIMNLVYPVGAVVTLGVSTNPGTLFGVGTWTAIAGKVIVGIDAGQTEFDTLDETGGEKTHLLTGAESGTSAHSHTIPTRNSNGYDGSAQFVQGSTDSGGGTTVATNNSSAADASSAHNNLQPYIVKYCWQRSS